jgi:hypothetical protein
MGYVRFTSIRDIAHVSNAPLPVIPLRHVEGIKFYPKHACERAPQAVLLRWESGQIRSWKSVAAETARTPF